MAAPAPHYDLMLLLDLKAEDAVRTKIRADVRAMIEGAGTLEENFEYGTRQLAYEIEKVKESEYDLVQFQGPPELLEQLHRTLRITDGVTRFRIIKQTPGAPPAPDLRQASTIAAAAEVQAAAAADDD